MTELKYGALIEAIINEQANDAKELTLTVLEGKINAEVEGYYNIVAEGIFGIEPKAVEVTEANFEELLNSLTEEQLAELEEELAAKEVEGLTEEELSEISKERVGSYAVKALGDREKQRTKSNDASSAKFKAGTAHDRVKRAGPDHGYETADNHADRVKNLANRRDKAGKEHETADRKYKNRASGLFNAGKRLAKD